MTLLGLVVAISRYRPDNQFKGQDDSNKVKNIQKTSGLLNVSSTQAMTAFQPVV